MWQAPQDLVPNQLYDVQLVTGRVVRHVWPTSLGNFARAALYVSASIVQKIRVSSHSQHYAQD